MIDNPVIFYSASVFIILFALLSLFAKNVVYSLLSSIVVFFFGALFFYVLGSEYNAIIQAAIYGFAVPVLIGLSIMFGGGKTNSKKKHSLFWYLPLFAGIFILAFVYLLMMSLVIMPDTFNASDALQVNAFDTIRTFARALFVDYVWAFELVSLLLTIVIAGLGMLRVTKHRGLRNSRGGEK